MADNKKDIKAFELMLKREMERETKGMSPSEKSEYIRNYFAKKKMPKKKVMTAAKGGMAKMAKKKMMRGGMAKKKMAGGGMAKMAKKKKMAGGGMAKMAKKKMMRGGMAKKK